MAFTVPVDRNGVTGNPASRGNCAATSRPTSSASMSASPSCIFMTALASLIMPDAVKEFSTAWRRRRRV
jgi:hypothetical protein